MSEVQEPEPRLGDLSALVTVVGVAILVEFSGGSYDKWDALVGLAAIAVALVAFGTLVRTAEPALFRTSVAGALIGVSIMVGFFGVYRGLRGVDVPSVCQCSSNSDTPIEAPADPIGWVVGGGILGGLSGFAVTRK